MSRFRSLDDFLRLIRGVKLGKDGQYTAFCPAHDDRNRSLSVKQTNGKILLKCFAGCYVVDILKSLNLDLKELFLDNHKGTGEYSNDGNPSQPVNGILKRPRNNVDISVTSGVNGVTLASLAKSKGLPIDFLKSLGVTDFKLNSLPVVRIPYVAEDGTEVAVRFRMSLSGNLRFKWRKGDHVLPYGLDRLEQARKAGWIMIVEGESDCWTCWYHRIPALGAPGKSIWPKSWTEYLEGLDVYVWQEPDAQDFTLRVLSTVPDLRYITAPEGIKDISEAHIQGLDIPSWLEELKAKAESGKTLQERIANAAMFVAYENARPILQDDDPLEIIANAIKGLGYGGDLKPAMIVYLAVTSRLLEMRQGAMPVHLLLMGQSSTGKNYTVGRILLLLPSEAYHIIDAGSPRVLIYDDIELKHKVLVFSEADSLPAGEDNPAASAIRNLLQDHYLHYAVTVRDPFTGNYTVKKVDKPGPTT